MYLCTAYNMCVLISLYQTKATTRNIAWLLIVKHVVNSDVCVALCLAVCWFASGLLSFVSCFEYRYSMLVVHV
jgi:hypothetical protein